MLTSLTTFSQQTKLLLECINRIQLASVSRYSCDAISICWGYELNRCLILVFWAVRWRLNGTHYSKLTSLDHITPFKHLHSVFLVPWYAQEPCQTWEWVGFSWNKRRLMTEAGLEDSLWNFGLLTSAPFCSSVSLTLTYTFLSPHTSAVPRAFQLNSIAFMLQLIIKKHTLRRRHQLNATVSNNSYATGVVWAKRSD